MNHSNDADDTLCRDGPPGDRFPNVSFFIPKRETRQSKHNRLAACQQCTSISVAYTTAALKRNKKIKLKKKIRVIFELSSRRRRRR